MSQSKQIRIDLPEKEAEGIYSNFAGIGFNQSEFILDFIRMMPGMQKGKVFSRIIMNPQNLKNLVLSLQNSLKEYEEKFGEIKAEKKDFQIGFNKQDV